ncbi:MAG: GNAT family N-acetyltransferase [Clostridiales bacterium]|nr:GNAT family N-acetyltransferase [Clostridiales bacterium]
MKSERSEYEEKANDFKNRRLILRAWNIEDAESLYEHASDPQVGPIAG